MKMGKNALWRQSDLGAEDAWDYLASQLTLAFATNDMKEGVAAFFAKRDPVWTNS
jgi:enoyl-CoA hydratase/carnithine racemase